MDGNMKICILLVERSREVVLPDGGQSQSYFVRLESHLLSEFVDP